MKRNTKTILLLLIAVAAIPSCKPKKSAQNKDNQVPTTPKVVVTDQNSCTKALSYLSDIKPLIDNSCAGGCHSAASHYGGIDLSNFEKVRAEAGKPRFLSAIKHEEGFVAMPKKNPKLSDSTIHQIECWVKNGMAP